MYKETRKNDVNDDDDGENGELQRGGEAQPEAKNMDFRCGNPLPGAKNLLIRCGNRHFEAKSLLFRCGEAPPEARNSDLRHGNRDSYINFMKRVPLSGQKSNKSKEKMSALRAEISQIETNRTEKYK